MRTIRMVSTREIAGKRIASIHYDTTPRAMSGGGPLHSGVFIRLDDGSILNFMTEESANGDDYGLFVWRSKP